MVAAVVLCGRNRVRDPLGSVTLVAHCTAAPQPGLGDREVASHIAAEIAARETAAGEQGRLPKRHCAVAKDSI